MPARQVDPHFVLTLPHLQSLYSQTRTSLLRHAQADAFGTAAAWEAVQGAFAAAAKNRFSFRSETSAVLWIREHISASVTAGTASAVADENAPFDWPDVLRRANIEISRVGRGVTSPWIGRTLIGPPPGDPAA
jgi:hypothetical protein